LDRSAFWEMASVVGGELLKPQPTICDWRCTPYLLDGTDVDLDDPEESPFYEDMMGCFPTRPRLPQPLADGCGSSPGRSKD
jgi:hypothetical protein